VNASDRPVEVDASAGKGVLVGDHGIQQNFFVEQRVAAAARIALAQLPPLVSGFAGRQVELAQVAGLLDPAASAGAVVVSAVAGLAGWARPDWRSTPPTPPRYPAGFRAGWCSSTCTATTRSRCSLGKRWTRCCGR